MNFNLPEELVILKQALRRFVNHKLIPLERRYRHDGEGPMPAALLAPLQEKIKAIDPPHALPLQRGAA
jgi:hypothetical protein